MERFLNLQLRLKWNKITVCRSTCIIRERVARNGPFPQSTGTSQMEYNNHF